MKRNDTKNSKTVNQLKKYFCGPILFYIFFLLNFLLHL